MLQGNGECGACVAFDMGSAIGPYRLDLGDVLYAPNLVQDPKVRFRLGGLDHNGPLHRPDFVIEYRM